MERAGPIRIGQFALALALPAVVAATSPAGAAETLDGDPWMRHVSALATRIAGHLPRPEVTFEAAGGDIETMVSVTLLDHLPDWRDTLAPLRRLVPGLE